MNPQKLLERLEQCIAALSRGNTQLKQLALKKDDTENKYRIALRKEMLKLKLEGYKTTLISDLAKGEETVAKLRLERDIAKDSYYVCLNAMDNLKIEIDCIRSQLTWLRVELKNS
jgi:hypothetical protein